ncbi:hypothetical protein TNCV_1221821 [Trichonephila clavipes]|nr:hypothetical protein TNCV_1221821 [Trichonephila clavipes]
MSYGSNTRGLLWWPSPSNFEPYSSDEEGNSSDTRPRNFHFTPTGERSRLDIFRVHRSPPDETHFWLNGYVNKQNCRIWSEANPQVYVETPLHPEKLTVWCALWAGGILLQKRWPQCYSQW